jgi:hypothetical protein
MPTSWVPLADNPLLLTHNDTLLSKYDVPSAIIGHGQAYIYAKSLARALQERRSPQSLGHYLVARINLSTKLLYVGNSVSLCVRSKGRQREEPSLWACAKNPDCAWYLGWALVSPPLTRRGSIWSPRLGSGACPAFAVIG